MASVLVCPSCGAAAPEGSETCALCGTALGGTPESSAGPTDSPTVISKPDAVPTVDGPVGASCGECGHQNPDGAMYCNQCGQPLEPIPAYAPLSDVSGSATTDGARGAGTDRPSSEPGKRALLLTLGAVGLIVVLWMVSSWSGRETTSSPVGAESEETATAANPAIGPAASIPDGPLPVLPDTMQAEADRFEAMGSASGWYEAGRYYLTAAFEARETNPQSSVQWARRAVSDFEKSLEIEKNVDVRFALAEATQYDPEQPMRVVIELRAVLDADPNHIGANFLMGERRFLIGRLDSARVSLEKVLELAEPSDPIRSRAQEVLAAVAAAQGA